MTPTQVRGLLAAHGLRASKALGQHFLADPNTAQRIVRLAGIGAGDAVVEVGPGVGSLTVALADAGAHVTAIELDRHVLPALRDALGPRAVEIVEGDALAVDWATVLQGSSRWSMVANLPYNVGTPIVMRALESAPMIEAFLVMMQREVGERLAADVGTRAYGAVSVKVAYYARATVVGTVSPTVFIPAPKVESALVRIERRAEPAVQVHDPQRLFALVRAGFATRRKTLRRALAAAITPEAFVHAGIDPQRRAETLTLAEWARLADA
ncbi:MAG TPA: 16S rRNA (adenine(1518)-N(6)/adenine(1519)-N(6))-dimethyltransferase RsmA [Acidimicrobiia bacterium]|nr:16S rRNA (adenine(1518)-N(6)/adenine(1519)-N(6))-dimethyltransferase RsmA [Acidimicrobiia bacterium]